MTEAGEGAEADLETTRRLLAWAVREPRPAPALTTIEIPTLRHLSAASVILNDAFRSFSRYDGLKVLRLGRIYEQRGFVSEAAINDVVASALIQAPRQPFASLEELQLNIYAAAMAPLARLLASVTRLTINMFAVGGIDGDDDTAAVSRLLKPLATLTQLRQLHVAFSAHARMAPADLRALSTLTQLRRLVLIGGSAHAVSHADVAALLRGLHHLRALRLDVDMAKVSAELPHVAGETCRRLRCLALQPRCHLGESLRAAQQTPLFPCLRSLELHSATMPEMRRRR
jgi:hypothetical protein